MQASNRIDVSASDTASVTSFLPSVSISIGIGASVAVSVTRNVLRSAVEASLGTLTLKPCTAKVTDAACNGTAAPTPSTDGGVSVIASSALVVHAATLVVSVGAGLGVATAVAYARSFIGGSTTASTGATKVDGPAALMTVRATSTVRVVRHARGQRQRGRGDVERRQGARRADDVRLRRRGRRHHRPLARRRGRPPRELDRVDRLRCGRPVAVGTGSSSTELRGGVDAWMGRPLRRPGAARTKITATELVHVLATSTEAAKTTGGSGGGGIVNVGAITVEATVTSSTKARIGAGVDVLRATDLLVRANVRGSSSLATVVIGSGGVVDVRVVTAIARNAPSVEAAVGQSSTIVTVSDAAGLAGDVTVEAIGRSEADSTAEAYGGGAVSVGAAFARAILAPSVATTIGSGTTITAARDITVKSDLRKFVPEDPVTDVIQGVDTLNDTIEFDFPLATGDTVVYDAPGTSPPKATWIGGLVDGATYTVRVGPDGKTVSFESTFAPRSVDAVRDVIVFARPHNLRSGDAVYYDPRGGFSVIEPWQTSLPAGHPLRVDPAGLFYVRGIPLDPTNPDVTDVTKIDPLRIRLVRTHDEAVALETALLKSFSAGGPPASGTTGNVTPSNNTITLPGDPFDEGQAVTYRATSSRFITEFVDVTVGTFTICGSTESAVDIQRTCNVPGVPNGTRVAYDGENNIFLKGHGFQSGDAVVYTSLEGLPIGNLTNGGKYYVIRVNDNVIKLAATYFLAVGYPGDNGDPDDPDDNIGSIQVTSIGIFWAAGAVLTDSHKLTRALPVSRTAAPTT